MILKYFRDMIYDKKVSVILTPLYFAIKKLEFIPVYRFEDLDKYVKAGYSYSRYKGLGSYNSSQMEMILTNPLEYVLQLPDNENEIDSIIKMTVDPKTKRLLINNNRCSIETIYKKIFKGDKNL